MPPIDNDLDIAWSSDVRNRSLPHDLEGISPRRKRARTSSPEEHSGGNGQGPFSNLSDPILLSDDSSSSGYGTSRGWRALPSASGVDGLKIIKKTPLDVTTQQQAEPPTDRPVSYESVHYDRGVQLMSTRPADSEELDTNCVERDKNDSEMEYEPAALSQERYQAPSNEQDSMLGSGSLRLEDEILPETSFRGSTSVIEERHASRSVSSGPKKAEKLPRGGCDNPSSWSEFKHMTGVKDSLDLGKLLYII